MESYEVTQKIRRIAQGVWFYPATIERVLRRCTSGQSEGRIRGPPYLEEIRVGIWRYSPESLHSGHEIPPRVGGSASSELRSERRVRSRRQRPKKYTRRYARNYYRLTKHPERYLAKVFDSRVEADIDTITAEVRHLAERTPFKSITVERVLRRYADGQRARTIRGPPYLHEVTPGVWRYSSV